MRAAERPGLYPIPHGAPMPSGYSPSGTSYCVEIRRSGSVDASQSAEGRPGWRLRSRPWGQAERGYEVMGEGWVGSPALGGPPLNRPPRDQPRNRAETAQEAISDAISGCLPACSLNRIPELPKPL